MPARNPLGAGSRLGMALDDWPAQGRSAWQAAFRPVSLLDLRPRGVEMAPTTRAAQETCYARWLVWLTKHHPETLPLRPSERATPERVIAYLESLRDEITIRTMVGYASRLQMALALMVPETDWSWMRPIVRRIERRALQDASIRHPFVPIPQLYDFGLQLMRQASDDEGLSDVARSEAFRDGLAIALLAARPLRRANFVRLRLGQHIDRRQDIYHISIPEEESKTRVALTFPVPVSLVAWVDRYLQEHRPVLLAERSAKGLLAALSEETAFWIGCGGTPWPSDTFADMISRRTMQRFGPRLTPHEFRHCAATSIAELLPAEANIIRVILGHSTLGTAERHYIHARRKAGALKHQAVIARRRQRTSAVD